MAIITAFTTPGLAKPINEDVVGINNIESQTIFCLCDGHWGRQAAKLACQAFITEFPSSKTQAVSILNSIQFKLFSLPKNDKPSETSVLAIRFDPVKLQICYVSYGDCRMLIARKNKIIFTLPTLPTWLGALSYTGARNRLPVSKGTFFGSVILKKTDRIYLFTDGVDECVYDTPTISHSWLIRHSGPEIYNQIVRFGAEDNASLIIFKC
jgi:serine/threonine protein phosphatase PrpC